jgi:hypothetical protein
VTLKPGPNLVGKVWEVWKPEMAFEWTKIREMTPSGHKVTRF